MGFHSFANSTQLVLELCLNSSSSSISSMPQNPSKVSINPTFDHHRPFCHQPSLTLALSGDSCGGAGGGSSFSNVSVKREREVASEESERVNTTSGTDDQEEEDGSVNGRKKLRLTKAQSGLLEEAFKLHTTLNPKQKQELARNLKLRPRQVEVWFQNRRARTKLKQTEVDCEYLKKCCERLRDENRRLRQEVEEVKAQKVTSVYMQSSMCPSCQQHTNPKTPLITIPPKPHFFNPFTNSSSAAC